MKRAIICAVAALLSACASGPVIRDRVVEVQIPVAVQPIAPADVPTLPKPLPPRPTSLSAAADVLLAKVCEWVAYGVRADPLLKVSSGQAPVAATAFPECETR